MTEFSWKKEPVNDAVMSDISKAIQGEHFDNVMLQVEQGKISAIGFWINNERKGTFLYRVENCLNGERHLVVLHIGGNDMDLESGLFALLMGFQDYHKCDKIRIHIDRPGFGRILKRNGFEETERIFEYGRRQ